MSRRDRVCDEYVFKNKSYGRSSEKIVSIAKELNKRYRNFSHHNKKNPLEELLFILCSVKRSEKVYLRAFKSLKRAFPSYSELNQASVRVIAKLVLWGGLQNQKARSLKNLMTAITKKFGHPSLAPLHKMTEAECEKFLCSLSGVGRKIARCVMLYSLDMKVFPVDSHCWRISRRLGWIKSTSKNQFCSSKDMNRLQEMIPPNMRLSLHVNMVSLGRDVCKARLPKCGHCPISGYCPKIGV